MVDLFVNYENPEVQLRAPLIVSERGDCGIDLYNASGENVIIPPRQSRDIYAGIRIKIPDGYFGIIRSRSSTFSRRGLFIVTGVIDSGYTGKIFTFVWNPALNNYDRPVIVAPWERLSQLLIISQPNVKIVQTFDLPETDRGDRGFGSTGL